MTTTQAPTPTPESAWGVEDCGWTPAACRRSQAQHGRGNDCPVHPWGVSLDKVPGQGHTSRYATEPVTRRPWYPLVGHRDGLRKNDMVTLASAFWILANEGGCAHQAPITPLAAIVGTPDN